MKNSRFAMFHARLSEVRAVHEFVAAFCAEAEVARERCLRLTLVLEELFVNTVQHGHRADCDAPIWMTLERRPGAVHVTYEDTAPPFNPYARLPTAPPETTIEMRKIGGLGVLLTKELAKTRDYGYIFGRNRVRLLMER